MTQHARAAYRRHRGGTFLALLLLAAGIAAVLAVSIPAAPAINEASDPGGVTPTTVPLGGESGDCAAAYGFSGSPDPSEKPPYEFRIVNPTSGTTYPDPATGAKFKVRVYSTNGKPYVELVETTGGAVQDIIIKGGTQSTWYHYGTPRTSDGKLHAPSKGSNTYYQVSHTTFCYVTVGTIDGYVYLDKNENHTRESSSDPAQGNWTVTVYKNGVAVKSADSDATTGYYKLENVPLGQDYVLCETAYGSGTWSQTQPDPFPPPPDPDNDKCASLSALQAGHGFTFNTSPAHYDFGNVPAVGVACNSVFQGTSLTATGTFEYEARINLPANTQCKSGSLVMFTYQSGNTRIATLHPPGDTTGTKYPVVERIKWTGVGPDQNPITLKYDDEYPYDGAGAPDMPMCTSDPRPNPVTSPFVVGSNADSVVPSGHSSCMIVSTETAGQTYEAYVYSKIDGWKGG